MKIRIWAITICLLLACSMCFANDMKSGATDNMGGEENALTTQASVDYLTFSVMLKKQTFIQDEPIEIKFDLVNNSDINHRLAEPVYGWTVLFTVYQIEGEESIPVQPISSRLGPPKDFGCVFMPGESKYSYSNVYAEYPKGIPPGRYALVAEYSVNNKEINQVDWYGSIKAPPIEFQIVKPMTEKEINARRIYLEMKKRSSKKATASSVIGMSSDIEKYGIVGEFNRGAESYEVSAYNVIGDIDGYKFKLLSYINKYGMDSFSANWLPVLGNRLRFDGNYVEARKIYEMLPIGYARIKGIAECDAMLSKSTELNK